MTCRSIPPALWEHARTLLVSYFFYRGHGLANAEDLAHDTLAALWRRDDYKFKSEKDFLRVCYAFARLVSLAAHRQATKRATVELEEDMGAPRRKAPGLNSGEEAVFLEEVLQAGRDNLEEEDWQRIQNAAELEAVAVDLDRSNSGRARVRLHRARKKLAEITGWKSLL
jgi:DNA-directed RNA polymerase specialized sigma24 family protein